MKQYIGSRGYCSIAVGYSAANVESDRYEMATCMNCGTDDLRSGFFAFDDYCWCDLSSFEQAGWDQKVQQLGNYSNPLFLSEYGCIKNERKFEEVAALYSDKITSVCSGGLVYEYSEEGSGTTAFSSNKAISGDRCNKADGQPSECSSQSSTWDVTDFTGADLPAIPPNVVQYVSKGASKGPGLAGAGSLESGGASVGTATPGSGAAIATATSKSSSAALASSSSAAQALDAD